MKARIFEIKRFAVHDGDGIRTTVFFKGCPLRCVWCHNPEGIGLAPQLSFFAEQCVGCGACVRSCPVGAHSMEQGSHCLDRTACTACGACESVCPENALRLYGKEMTVDELLPLLLEDRDFYEASGGGVTLSGGECLLRAEFCASLLKALKGNGIHTAVDTCGFVPVKAIAQVLPYTDLFLYDIKAMDETVHMACTGRSNQLILENLAYIDSHGTPVEIRIPLVPHYNSDQIEPIADYLSRLRHPPKVRLLPYHNYAGSKYTALAMAHTLPEQLPDQAMMERARQLLNKYNLICK